jgi:hypothetical protein
VKTELYVVSISSSTPCVSNTVKYSTVTLFRYFSIYYFFDQSVLFSCGWFKVTAGRPLTVRNVRTSGIVNWERPRRKRSCSDRLRRFHSGGTEKLQLNM